MIGARSASAALSMSNARNAADRDQGDADREQGRGDQHSQTVKLTASALTWC